MDRNHRPSRRRLLFVCGIALTPGCTQPAAESTSSATPTGTPSPTTDTTLSVSELTLAAGETRCGDQPDNSAETDGKRLIVTGRIIGKTPCRQPVVQSATTDTTANRLQIDIGTREPDDTGACATCLAELSYTVTASVNERLAELVVRHRGTGTETFRYTDLMTG